ncbi:hypothetical protein BDK51DRAFT_46097 [Blyttiomyces helicus]|uniref:Uncharacterized protein n=1 Tax=Blyttiomyces helicus TaxID=388810 RepID=A0A4P9WEN8_9FUNG|nr:hypothetical protein BDK51DRAFT_46097 [Blyttiomyces helicus]|eukprot:RKO90255.1 hypothetical protein BDK51DRAFT_46097 [Blyttiomyces helicus]
MLAARPPSASSFGDIANVDSLTEAELRWSLTEALAALRQKEIDLHLAAEIGQQLVEANKQLMAELEEAIARSNSVAGSSTPRGVNFTPLPISPSPHPPPASDYTTDTPARPRRTLRRRSQPHPPTKTPLEVELLAQLDASIENLQTTERMHARTVASLRSTNASLHDQLRSTLADLRDAEQAHARSVRALEADIDALRNELNATAQGAKDLQSERRRLLAQSKEARIVESSDASALRELVHRVGVLEGENARLVAGNREAERRAAEDRAELERLRMRTVGLDAKIAETTRLRRELEKQKEIADELAMKLEEMRARAEQQEEETAFLALVAGDGDGAVEASEGESLARFEGEFATAIPDPPPVDSACNDVEQDDAAIATAAEADICNGTLVHQPSWELQTWASRVHLKVWERDVNGIRAEIADLRAHRTEVLERVQTKMSSLRTSLLAAVAHRLPADLAGLVQAPLAYVPAPVISITERIASPVITLASPFVGLGSRALGWVSGCEKPVETVVEE